MMKTLLVLGLVLAVTPAMTSQGRLLEYYNSISKSTSSGFRRAQCLTTDRSGIAPCDTDPMCCLKDSPRIPGSDYCCPPFTTQYQFKSEEGLICACAL